MFGMLGTSSQFLVSLVSRFIKNKSIIIIPINISVSYKYTSSMSCFNDNDAASVSYSDTLSCIYVSIEYFKIKIKDQRLG